MLAVHCVTFTASFCLLPSPTFRTCRRFWISCRLMMNESFNTQMSCRNLFLSLYYVPTASKSNKCLSSAFYWSSNSASSGFDLFPSAQLDTTSRKLYSVYFKRKKTVCWDGNVCGLCHCRGLIVVWTICQNIPLCLSSIMPCVKTAWLWTAVLSAQSAHSQPQRRVKVMIHLTFKLSIISY